MDEHLRRQSTSKHPSSSSCRTRSRDSDPRPMPGLIDLHLILLMLGVLPSSCDRGRRLRLPRTRRVHAVGVAILVIINSPSSGATICSLEGLWDGQTPAKASGASHGPRRRLLRRLLGVCGTQPHAHRRSAALHGVIGIVDQRPEIGKRRRHSRQTLVVRGRWLPTCRAPVKRRTEPEPSTAAALLGDQELRLLGSGPTAPLARHRRRTHRAGRRAS